MKEKYEIATVGKQGQIVIPQRLRKELAITPNTKLCVYRKEDKLVVAKLKFPPLANPEDLFKKIDEQNKGKKKLNEEVLKEIKVKSARGNPNRARKCPWP